MIADYIFYDSDGVIKLSQSCTAREAKLIQERTGLLALEHCPVDPFAHVVSEGCVRAITAEAATEAARRAEPTPTDVAAAARRRRDILLQASDWTQLPDVPPATSHNWADYRQALRDVTKQDGFPSDVRWPIPGDAPLAKAPTPGSPLVS